MREGKENVQMKSKALSIVVLLLTVVLFGLLFVNQRQEQRQTAYMQQLQKEAMPYEQEINDIRLELAQKQRAINIEEDTSGILFGFVPASADDFTEIDKLAAEHSITPVILLDCSQEKEQLAQILEKAVAKDYEVVLAGLQIDESILQTADEMKDLLAQIYLMACSLQGTKPEEALLANIDMEALLRLAKAHSVSAMVCMALEQTDAFQHAAETTRLKWLDCKNKAVRKNMLLDAERHQLEKEFAEHGIWYMPLKGSILKDWYPKFGMREMADNDILFDASKRKEVKAIFQGRGYTVKEYDKSNHDAYEKPPINVLCVFYPLAPNAQ